MKHKNIPELRFPEFEGEWEEKKIKDFGKVSMCKRILKKQTSAEAEIPFYKIGTFGKECDAFVERELFEEYKLKYSFPKRGDILISAAGTIGRTVVFDGKPAYFQDSNIVWIDNDEQTITNNFLAYCYKNVHWITEDTTIKRLYNDTLRNIRITIPTLPEQTRIATFLTAVDKRIQLLQQKKTGLERYKKGVMQRIFVSNHDAKDLQDAHDFKNHKNKNQGNQDNLEKSRFRLRFKKEDGTGFPAWEEKKLGEVSKISTGSSNRQDSGLNGEFTFFDRSDDIRTSNIYLFDTEAVIVPGEGSDFIPKYFIGKFDLHQRTYAITHFENLLGKFLFYRMQFSRKHLLRQAVGSTVKSLRLPMFQNWILSIPSLAEQQKIASFLSAIDKKIEKTEGQIAGMQEWKKGLLQKMFV